MTVETIERVQVIRVRNPEDAAKGRMRALHERGITAMAEALPGGGVKIRWLVETIEHKNLGMDTVSVESVWRQVDYVQAPA